MPRPQEAGLGMLSNYRQLLKRHLKLIVLCACIGVATTLLMGLGVLPMFTTRTSLEIRSVNQNFMDMRSVAPTSSDASGDNDMNLQTQIKLLQSDTLIEDVGKRLLAEPHPASIPRKDALSSIAESDTPGWLQASAV